MEDHFSISAVTENELHELRELAILTFQEAYAKDNSIESMEQYEAEKLSVQVLAQELAHPHSFFFFLKHNAKPIGYLKLNIKEAQTESLLPDAMEVERIYVQAGWQGKGLGSNLLQEAYHQAQQRGINTIWLGVWEKNPKALAFYRKHGFEEFGRHDFVLGTEAQTDIMMKGELSVLGA